MRDNTTQELVKTLDFADDQQSYGPAMAALPLKERHFVHLIVHAQLPHATAAREAGFGVREDGSMSEPKTLASLGYRLTQRQRVIDAIAEESRKLLRNVTPNAVRAIHEIVNDRFHRDRGKVALAVVERIDPTVQRVEGNITHTHIVDHAAEELNQFRTLKALNVATDKLIEVFGQFGLERLEKKLALEDKRGLPMAEAKDIVEAQFVEVQPGADADGL